MSLKNILCAGGLVALLAASAQAAVVLNYDLTGAAVGGVATWAPTTAEAGITGFDLTRGPGVNQAGLTNGFSSDNWTLNSSPATAQANGDYYQWGLTVQPGYEADLASTDFALRRSATNGPSNFELYASTDGFATAGQLLAQFQYLGRSSGTAPATVTPFQWMTTDTPGQNAGNLIPAIDLSVFPMLQDIAGGTTVTFRLYVWGDLAGAADSNTVALGRIDGPEIQGAVTLIPEPAALSLVGLAGLGALRRRR